MTWPRLRALVIVGVTLVLAGALAASASASGREAGRVEVACRALERAEARAAAVASDPEHPDAAGARTWTGGQYYSASELVDEVAAGWPTAVSPVEGRTEHLPGRLACEH